MNSESSKKRTEYSCVKSQNMMDMATEDDQHPNATIEQKKGDNY